MHLNLPFREPLVPTGEQLVDAPGRSDGRPWTAHAPGARVHRRSRCSTRSPHLVADRPRGLIVAGWGAGVRPSTVLRFAEVAGWPVLADPLSNLRVPGTIAALRPAAARPRVRRRRTVPTSCCASAARPPTSRSCSGSTPSVDQVLVDPDGAWLDPQHAVSGRMVADPELLLGALADAVDVMVDEDVGATRGATPTPRRAPRSTSCSTAGTSRSKGASRATSSRRRPPTRSLVVASSMPVRDVESFAPTRDGVTFHANRGVNGIDGFVSTALGIAAGSDGADRRAARRPVLPARHATGCSARSTAASTRRSSSSTTAAAGSSRSSRRPTLPEHFETLFGTPQAVDLGALAAVHGIPVDRGRARRRELEPALRAAVDAGGVRVVRVRTDRAANVTRHREVWAAVARAIA